MATVGMVSTRFAGLDGVSLETAKIAAVLREAGHDVVWFAGRLGEAFRPGREVPAAHFDTPQNRALQAACFGMTTTSAEIRRMLESRTQQLRSELEGFVADFDVDVLMPQNCNAIPMHFPLGMATARLIEAGGIRTVAHHHDLRWERDRFAVSAVDDLLDYAFPPDLPTVRHLTINSLSAAELARRRGIVAAVLPNVMDFEHPARPGDGARFRRYAGVGPGDTLLLQPTRIVPRKAIEETIALAARLGDASVKVRVSHPERDEGDAYGRGLERLAADAGVDYAVTPVAEPDGPTLADAYAAADLVTYPSRIEGFGNALLEAWFYRVPLLVNRYAVYVADVAPLGPQCIEMDGGLDDAVVSAVAQWLEDPEIRAEAAEHNYEIGRRYFSYARVRQVILPLIGR